MQARLDDADLMRSPPGGPLTPPTLFVCTYVALLTPRPEGLEALTQRLCAAPHGCLLAVNTNFGHNSQPGYEYLIKHPKPPPTTRARPRKPQGDGTCFNNAVEPAIVADRILLPALPARKTHYNMKYFPSTGQTQIPGVVLPDLADGRAALAAFVAYMAEIGAPVDIVSQQPKMLNYKFQVVVTHFRALVNLRALAVLMAALEAASAIEGQTLSPAKAAALRVALAPFGERFAAVAPPFMVRETKPPADDGKVSFRFLSPDTPRSPRINIFQSGKIDILGAESDTSVRRIYDYFWQLFRDNWADFVCLRPRPDAELAAPCLPARRSPQPRPLPPLPVLAISDIEFEAIFADSTLA